MFITFAHPFLHSPSSMTTICAHVRTCGVVLDNLRPRDANSWHYLLDNTALHGHPDLWINSGHLRSLTYTPCKCLSLLY